MSFFASSINSAVPLKISRWWEIVSWRNVPPSCPDSPQVRFAVAAVASHIASPRLSASAFECVLDLLRILTVSSAQHSLAPATFLEAAEVLVFHLVLASIVLCRKRTKTSMGQYSNTRSSESNTLATGPKTLDHSSYAVIAIAWGGQNSCRWASLGPNVALQILLFAGT